MNLNCIIHKRERESDYTHDERRVERRKNRLTICKPTRKPTRNVRRFRAVASRLWYNDENVLQMLALPLAVVFAVALLCFGSDEIVSLIMAGGWYKIYRLEQREKGTWRFGRTPAYFFASHACVPSSNAADSAWFFLNIIAPPLSI